MMRNNKVIIISWFTSVDYTLQRLKGSNKLIKQKKIEIKIIKEIALR